MTWDQPFQKRFDTKNANDDIMKTFFHNSLTPASLRHRKRDGDVERGIVGTFC